jgi:hypothetical protein
MPRTRAVVTTPPATAATRGSLLSDRGNSCIGLSAAPVALAGQAKRTSRGAAACTGPRVESRERASNGRPYKGPTAGSTSQALAIGLPYAGFVGASCGSSTRLRRAIGVLWVGVRSSIRSKRLRSVVESIRDSSGVARRRNFCAWALPLRRASSSPSGLSVARCLLGKWRPSVEQERAPP